MIHGATNDGSHTRYESFDFVLLDTDTEFYKFQFILDASVAMDARGCAFLRVRILG